MSIAYSGKEGDGENVASTLAKYAGKIAEVKSKLTEKVTETTDDTFIYHYLKDRKFDVVKAAEGLSKTLKWRAELKVDEIRAKSATMGQDKWPHSELFAKYCPQVWMHRTDRKGRVLGIELSGHTRPAEFVKSMSQAEFNEFAIWLMERKMVQMLEMQKTSGVMQRCSLIMDMSGLGLKHLDMAGLAYSENAAAIFKDHYPDLVAEIFIVNAPWLFNTFWRFASGWMAEDVRNSTRVLPDQDKLKEFVDPANLPLHLGGTCKTCVGGCVKEVDPLDGFTKVDVKASSPHLVKIDIEKGSLVSWEYRSSHEIGMGASYVPKGEAKQIVVPMMRRRSDLRGIDGGLNAAKDGLLTLAWDNQYDSVAKTVWYRLDIKKANTLDSSIVLDTSAAKSNA